MVDMRRNQLVLAVAAAVLTGAVLGGASVVVWQRVRPRLPTLATATATLDQAIAAVVAAAGDDAAVAVTGLVPSVSCSKTPLAKGNAYTRTADLYTDTDREDIVIDRIAAGLPADEHAQRKTPAPGGASSLTADLGSGIHLQVLPVSSGWLAATATTDCRIGDQAQPALAQPPSPTQVRSPGSSAYSAPLPLGSIPTQSACYAWAYRHPRRDQPTHRHRQPPAPYRRIPAGRRPPVQRPRPTGSPGATRISVRSSPRPTTARRSPCNARPHAEGNRCAVRREAIQAAVTLGWPTVVPQYGDRPGAFVVDGTFAQWGDP